MSGIPERSRRLVKERERFRCARCGGPGSQWHHRRGRAVRGDHQHCACNGVWLCHECHRWAHDYPDEARRDGWIVTRDEEFPWMVPTLRFGQWWAQNCEGVLLHLPRLSVTVRERPEVALTQLVQAGLIPSDVD